MSTDVSAAVDLVAREQVDVCLLDLQLPEGTSVPYIPELLERSPGMKIVILSGTDDADLLRSGLAAGAVAAARKSDDIDKILEESIGHERAALRLYRKLLETVKDQSVYLEEYARTQIGAEEMHLLEMNKMLRDYSIGSKPLH